MANEGGDIGLAESALIHPPGDRQRHQKNRVTERIFVPAGAQPRRQPQEFLGKIGGGQGRWHIGHEIILAA